MISADMITLTQAAPLWKKWNGREWIVADVWECHIKTEKFEFHLKIYPGFKTDGGTIPKIFQNIISPLGVYLLAFLIHDALYAAECCTRAEADWILLELCEWLGAWWIRRNEIYAAVRAWGWLVWKKHSKKSIATAKTMIEFKPISGFEQLTTA